MIPDWIPLQYGAYEQQTSEQLPTYREAMNIVAPSFDETTHYRWDRDHRRPDAASCAVLDDA